MRAILTYHSIDRSGSPISIEPRQLAAHLAWLAAGPVRVMSLEALWRAGDSGDAVALTFDDAFSNFASEAAPLLAEHRLPATLFVPTDHVGGSNAWPGTGRGGVPSLPLLDWDALGRAAEQGVSLGAHGRRHVALAGLPAAELRDEVAGSAELLQQRTGVRPRTFAYPFGSVDAAAVRTVRDVFEIACSTELRPLAAGDDPACLPRLDAYYLRDPRRLSSWGTPAFRRYLRVRAIGRRVRQLGG